MACACTCTCTPQALLHEEDVHRRLMVAALRGAGCQPMRLPMLLLGQVLLLQLEVLLLLQPWGGWRRACP